MKKAIKISAYILGTLIALYIIMAIVLTQLIKPKTYESLINDAFSQKTGRTLVINGSMKLSVFPWIGLRVNNVTITNPKNFNAPNNAPYFAKIGELDIKVALLPLFTGKLDAKKLIVKQAKINLVKITSGENNWGFKAPVKAKPVKQVIKTVTTDSTKQTPKARDTFNQQLSTIQKKLSLPSIYISHANVNWINQQTNTITHIQDFNLHAKLGSQLKNIDLETSLAFSNNKPAISASIKAVIKGKMDWQQGQWQLPNVTLDATLTRYHQTLAQPIKLEFIGGANADLKQQTLSIKKFILRLNGLNIQGELSGHKILTMPLYQGTLRIANFNLNRLLQSLKMPPNNNSSLKDIAVSFDFQGSPKFIKLTNLQATIDQTNIMGSFDASTIEGKNAVFSLDVNHINLDQYIPLFKPTNVALPAPTQTQQQTANSTPKITIPTSVKKANINASILPVALLKQLNWDGTIKVGKIIYHGVQMSNFSVTTEDQQGKISFAPIRVTVGKGNIASNIKMDLQEDTPKISSNASISNLDLQTLFKLMQTTPFITGTLNMQTILNTTGNTQHAWLSTLSGSGSVKVSDGTLASIDIVHMVQLGQAFLSRKQIQTQQTSTNSTRFASLQATYNIQNGTLTNNDLAIMAPNLSAKGTGQIDLANQRILYHLQANYKNSEAAVPILLSGALTKPKIGLDTKALSHNLLKSTIKKGFKKLLKLF